jgi:alcohol dehydrogenase (cytochrome c)
MRTKFILMLGGAFFLLSGLYAVVGAQGAAKSTNDGIFTDAQARRGDSMYKEQCATCHGDNLEGSGPMPALAGKDFLANWQGKTVGDLFDKTSTTMPATAPGSLTPAQAADIVSYLLASSRFKSGSTELVPKVEALQQFKIEAPK